MIGSGELERRRGATNRRFFYPGITALSLRLVIAWWAILTGIFEIVAAVKLRKELTNEWLLIVSGALSVLFGVLVIAMPGAGLFRSSG